MSKQSHSEQDQARHRRRRRPLLRRLLVVLLVLVVLAVVLVGAVHVALQSDLPRQIAEQQIERTTGLRAEVESVTITWGGTTNIRGVSLTTPLEDEPIARIDAIEAKTSPLAIIALTRAPGLEVVEIEGVELALRQHADGQWNIQEVLGRLEGEEDEPAGAPGQLPRVELRDAVVTVDDAEGRHVALEQITLSGEPVGTVAFMFEASAEPGVAASGRIDLGGNQRHRVDFALTGIRELAHDWIAELDLPQGDLAVGGQWSGEVQDGTLRGRLAVTTLQAGPLAGQGVLRVDAGGERVAVDVTQWDVSLEDLPVDRVRVTGGRIELVGDELALRRLELDVMQNRVWVTGRWSLAEQSGEARLSWSGRMAEVMNLRHEGEGQVKLESVTPTRQRITASFESSGSIDAGRWQGSGRLVGSGPSPREMTWDFRLPRGEWADAERTLTLDDSGFEAAVALPQVTVNNVRLAGQPISGELRADTVATTWQADLATRQWSVPRVDLPGPVNFTLRAKGDPAVAIVETFSLQTQGLDVAADGKYMYGAERPLEANFRTTLLHEVQGVADAPLSADATAPRDPLEQRFGGRVSVEGSVQGSVAPVALEVAGDLHADQLVVNHYRLHDVATPFTAQVRDDQVTARTTDYLDLLGGRIGVGVRYSQRTQTAQAGLDLQGLDLSRAALYADPNLDLGGTVAAGLAVSVPERDLSRLRATGEWSAQNLRMGDLARVDSAEGELSTRRSLLQLEPIVLEQGGGVAAGSATYDLLDARTVHAELSVTQWPMNLEAQRIESVIDGEVALNLDVIDAEVNGQVDIGAHVKWRDRVVGPVYVQGGLSREALTLERIDASVLGGRVEGSATLDLADPYASRASLQLEQVDLAEAEPWLVFDDELHGRLDGELVMGPARLGRAPEPLQIDIRLEPHEDAGYRQVLLGRSVATLFAGPERYLLHDSSLGVAGGRLRLWAQAVPRDGRWFVHTRADADRLDLDVLSRTLDPEGNPMIGRLSGNVSAFGFADDRSTLAGDGLVRLSESDLAQTRIIGAVYQTMNLNFTETDPTGSGRVRVRMDSGQLRIEEFQYFNRGVDIYGTATVTDLALGMGSPLDATLVGTLRPLRGVNLPFAADIDRLLRSLQTVAGSVRVGGTVENPDPQQATLADVQATIERLLGPQQRE